MSGMSAGVRFRPGHGPDSPGYRMCATTVMDTSDPGLRFDPGGNCQFVEIYRSREKTEILKGETGRAFFDRMVAKLKQGSRDGKDCLCGVSGGVDSSWVLVKAVEAGLRPLAVHVDNGWNHELAVHNIEVLTSRLGVELHTEVLDWATFRDLQRSFFRASVPNVEMVTDHAINAVLFRLAAQTGIRTILSGSNLVTEAFLPTNAGHDNKDWKHIREVYRRFQGRFPRRYPRMNAATWIWSILVRKVRFFPILNYLDYDREEAKEQLKSRYGWKDYGRKHGESLFTRFFQEHYLPAKFGIDKRRAHFSCQILAGKLSRSRALELLAAPLWEPDELASTLEYVARKLGFSPAEFEGILQAAPRPHDDYPTHWAFRNFRGGGYQWIRKIATGRNRLSS